MKVLTVLKDNHLGFCLVSRKNLAGPGRGDTYVKKDNRLGEGHSTQTCSLERSERSIFGLCEMRWKKSGEIPTDGGHGVYFSRKENKHEHGVGFLVHKDIVKCHRMSPNFKQCG